MKLLCFCLLCFGWNRPDSVHYDNGRRNFMNFKIIAILSVVILYFGPYLSPVQSIGKYGSILLACCLLTGAVFYDYKKEHKTFDLVFFCLCFVLTILVAYLNFFGD